MLGKKYSRVSINDHGGDLNKRWYIHFEFRNPRTGKMQSFKKYAGINRIKTVTERRKHIKQLRNDMEELLQDGFSPFQKYIPEQSTREETPVGLAIDHIVEIKRGYLRKSSFKTFEARVKIFKAYLEERDKSHLPANEVTRSDITQFLQWVQETRKISNFSRNNYLTDVRGLFSKLMEEEYTYRNPTLKIKFLPAQPQKNRAFTEQQLKTIRAWLVANDPNLLHFIRWVAYAFLRPVEVCRIQIKGIDLENALLYVPTKTRSDKKKRIIARLLEDLKEMDLSSTKPMICCSPGWENPVSGPV